MKENASFKPTDAMVSPRIHMGLVVMLIGFLAAQYAAGGTIAPGTVMVSTGEGKVTMFDQNGNNLGQLDTTTGGNGDTAGSTFDAAGNFFVTVFSRQQVTKFDPTGALIGAFGSGYNSDPESIVVDASGNVYVGQADGSHMLLKFDANGNLLATFSPARDVRGTDWIDLDSDQCTLFYTSEGGLVKRFDVCTNTQLTDLNSVPLPGLHAYAQRILPCGGVLVADYSAVIRLDASGNQVQTYTLPGTSQMFALNLDPDGTSFWAADLGSGDVFKVDIASGTILKQWSAAGAPGFIAAQGLTVKGGTIVGCSSGETGHLEVCKQSNPAFPVTGTFNFLVTGVLGTVSVPVGECSEAIQVSSGSITITETPPAGVTVSDVTAYSIDSSGNYVNELISWTSPNPFATVNVVAGDVSLETIATFTNSSSGETGYLEVCKQSNPQFPVTGTFNFQVTQITGAVSNISVPVGECSGAMQVISGPVTITEAPPAGVTVSDVTAYSINSSGNYVDQLVSWTSPNPDATVNVVAGDVSLETIATFTNSSSSGNSGELKICKIAGTGVPVGTPFNFSTKGTGIKGKYTIEAGPASQGGNCELVGSFPVGTQLTVKETVPRGIYATIQVQPPANGSNYTASSVKVTIGKGITEVDFTDSTQKPLTATLSPPKANFGALKVGTTGAPKTFTLTNNGTINMNITSIAIGGTNPGDFIINSTTTCGPQLAGGATCTINVSFQPTQHGLRKAQLIVTDDASNSPQVSNLTGVGV
jgi:hypothetical protein